MCDPVSAFPLTTGWVHGCSCFLRRRRRSWEVLNYTNLSPRSRGFSILCLGSSPRGLARAKSQVAFVCLIHTFSEANSTVMLALKVPRPAPHDGFLGFVPLYEAFSWRIIIGLNDALSTQAKLLVVVGSVSKSCPSVRRFLLVNGSITDSTQ